MITYVGKDDVGVEHYVLAFDGLAFPSLSWGDEEFDCILFPPVGAAHDKMEALLECLPYGQMDWVHVAGPDAEYWHDRIDRKSVEKGVQTHVGEGHPMTAWFEDMESVDDWDTGHNLGGMARLLLVFADLVAPLEELLAVVRKKVQSA